MKDIFRCITNFLSIVSAGIAAYYWFKASSIATPKTFIIHVVKPRYGMPLMGPDAEYAGQGQSEELTELAEALVEQSRLSAKGAKFAGVSAVLLAISAML